MVYVKGDDMVTQERLKELLNYDPDTGVFTWKRRDWYTGKREAWNVKYADKPAGCVHDSTGYVKIRVDKRLYLAHRLAWIYVHGKISDMEIDHINHNGVDNRLVNLRLATSKQNKFNKRISSKNASGYKGISFHKKLNKWAAYISRNKKTIYLGLFDTPQEAHKEYTKAADHMFMEFACHG